MTETSNQTGSQAGSQSGSQAGFQSAGKIYGVVLGVGIACSVAIVGVYQLTLPVIARNRIALRETAILQVLDGATRIATYRFDPAEENFQSAPGDAEGAGLVFAGFDDGDQLVGVAIEAEAIGYQDVIRMLYGYSPEQQAIIGTRVVESRETPGLGDRIETDTTFLENFRRLDVALDAGGEQLAHPIEFVKPGQKTEAWQIDGITGATISSRTTAEMLRDSSSEWIPRIYRQLPDFALSEQQDRS